MNIQNKKVWFVAHQAELGGAERSLLDMIDVFVEMGANCHVIVPDTGPFTKKLSERGISFTVVAYRWWVSTNKSRIRRYARKMLNSRAVRKIKNLLMTSSVDLVVTNTIAIHVGAMAAKSLHIPHVWVIREFGKEDHGLLFDEGIEKSTYKMGSWSDVILHNSKAVLRKYEKWFPNTDRQLIYFYFDPPETEEPNLQEMMGRFAIVGAIQPGKGQVVAIRAISKLNREGLCVRLDIYGDGRPEYVDEMNREIIKLEADDFIKWHGRVPSAWEVISKADGLLVCSRNEAFGRVTVEGMLMGTPVIGAASGGTIELIGSDEERGYLFQPDDANDLAGVIKEAMNAQEERKDKVKRARAWAERTFTKKRYKEALEEVLNKI
jgi:glycosyltransferase involved in cell wall biosynthesis